jgi:hypothetical protein
MSRLHDIEGALRERPHGYQLKGISASMNAIFRITSGFLNLLQQAFFS